MTPFSTEPRPPNLLSYQKTHHLKTQELLTFDTDKYDLKWELTPSEALTVLRGPPTPSPLPSSTNTTTSPSSTSFQAGRSAITSIPPHRWSNPFIIDLRQPTSPPSLSPLLSPSYKIHSSPLPNLTPTTPNPLADLTMTDDLRQQWTALKAKFGGGDVDTEALLARKPADSVVVVLCYHGETSRIATAVLRARGVEAFSVRGGTGALGEMGGLDGGEGNARAQLGAVKAQEAGDGVVERAPEEEEKKKEVPSYADTDASRRYFTPTAIAA